MVLIDVDPAYSQPEEFLPQAKAILDRHKLTWPNTIAPKGFNDIVHAFNLSGYGTVVVDAKGVVRGVNLHDKDLEQLLEAVAEGKTADKPGR